MNGSGAKASSQSTAEAVNLPEERLAVFFWGCRDLVLAGGFGENGWLDVVFWW